MSYFYDAFDEFILKNRIVSPDGQGGYIVNWEDGPTVPMSLDRGTAAEIRQAESQQLQTVFTVTFPADTPVRYGDYVQSVNGRAVYRITSEPSENKTPPEARFQTCFATAIRTELPQ